MGRLSIYLPPFSGDYSGVCSVLFDLNCLIVILDASCCTKNYIDYDEPRWSRDKTTAMCAQLRTLEAALGDDRRIMEQTLAAARETKPELIALLGSPVPAILGMDMAGMARELESLSGIPCMGFDTSGFESYHCGVEKALMALFRRFGEEPQTKTGHSLNILGVTPLDVGNTGAETAIRSSAEAAGYSVLSSLAMGYSLRDVSMASRAELNLVPCAAGLPLARLMKERFGIPYIAGMPIGPNGVESLLKGEKRPPVREAPESGILIVGEQLTSNAIRNALRRRGFNGRIDAAGFFAMDRELMEPGDRRLEGEAGLIRMAESGNYSRFVGDPLFRRIPQPKKLMHTPLPHPAVSGRFGWNETPVLASDDGDRLIDEIMQGGKI